MRYPLVALGAAVLLLATTGSPPARAQERITSVVRSGELIWANRYSPRFSHDGTCVAYVEELHLGGSRTESNVWFLDLGTLQATRVSAGRGGLDPAWSSDGKQLAFIEPGRGAAARGQLMVYNRASFAVRPVTVHDDVFQPAWFGGEERLAYLRHTDEGGAWRTAICTIRADGSDYQEVKSWSLAELPGNVVWANSGRAACYWAYAPAEMVEGRAMRRLVLRTIDLDTKQERDLPIPPDTRHVGRACWSPDDTQIAIEATFDKNLTEIWAIPAVPDAGAARRVTVSEAGESFYHPAWIAGNDSIVCVKYPREDAAGGRALPLLLLVDARSHVQSVLTPDWARPVDPSADMELCAAPTGTTVVVAADSELRFMELGTERQRNMVLAADRIREVGRALVRFAAERNGGMMPRPREGEKADTFWIDLIKDSVSGEGLRSPGDPDNAAKTSFRYPETAYGLDARLVSKDREKVILIERSGIHLGGHHELRMNGEVLFVPDTEPPAPPAK